MITQSVLFSLLSLQTLASASVSPFPRELIARSNPLQIRQSGDESCLGSVCPSGDCIPAGYQCCSDGAGCPIGSDCVTDGCCPSGETCSGGGGTMTFPGGLVAPTLSGLGALSSAAASFSTPDFDTIDSNTLSSFGDAYSSFLATEFATATGSLKSALGSAQDILSSADNFLSTATGEVPAAVAAPTTSNGAVRTKETSSTTKSTSTTPTAQSTRKPAAGSSPTPQSQPASGAKRGVSGVWFGGIACAGLFMVMWAL